MNSIQSKEQNLNQKLKFKQNQKLKFLLLNSIYSDLTVKLIQSEMKTYSLPTHTNFIYNIVIFTILV